MLTRDDLHDDQRVGIEHIHAWARIALWSPMGSGKSVITLTALDDLSYVEPVWPALVVSTVRVARTVWPNEPSEWSHLRHLRVSVVTGDAKARAAALKADADIYTINFENLPWLRKHLGSDWPFRTVVIDESTRLGGLRLRQGSKQAAALRDVAHTAVDRFIELTGTPAPTGFIKLWGQVWFLDEGKRLGRTYTAFEQRWFEQGWDGYSLTPKSHAGREIEGLLQGICLTLEGPPVDEPVWSPVYVDLPQDARALYRDMEKEMFAEIGGHEVEAFNAAARTGKCHQLAQGAAIVDSDDGKWEEVHRVKLDALDSIIEEAAGAPVLVAYWFKSDLARLKKAFPYGRTLDADPRTVQDWNDGRIRLLFVQPASSGHGINLARGGNILALFSLFWPLELYLQIIERIGPLRQKQAGLDRPVWLYPIIARGTVDEDIVTRWQTHRSVQDILLESMRRRKVAA